MQLIRSLDELEKPLSNPVLTIGNFDGVHRGHLAIFNKVKERAGAIGGQSAVMTFDPHPMKLLRPDEAPPMITEVPRKLELIGEAGIDVIFCLKFNENFAAISAADFIKDILVRRIGVREIVVGYDYVFGNKRQGDIELLRKMGSETGFLVHVMPPISMDGTTVSSTAVRRLVKDGSLREAAVLLGRYHQISGTVVRGMNRGGRLLGFPTANLSTSDELIPRSGVYAVKAQVDGRTFDGVANIGCNPTFPEKKFSVEAHLFGFSGDLVGKNMALILIERLRDEKTFESLEALASQIKRDADAARKILSSETS
ncbi:MAG: bifunctional riboflavin kinase/FAD synthetase [Desulfobacteraceae bacterium]|jgi:riboflavin kinase/FMN adenylyltransferase|nr:MAG: bifunctional riboflavin kinase/FAD synthetase [Desulfobacteraceae bacterium]